jgi:hypothetical protein
MASISIGQEARELETHVRKTVAQFDLDDLPREQRAILIALKNNLVDARLDARDYEYAQTRADQLEASINARNRLEQTLQLILKASEFGVFSAVDVAHLSAGVQHLMSRMD